MVFVPTTSEDLGEVDIRVTMYVVFCISELLVDTSFLPQGALVGLYWSVSPV